MEQDLQTENLKQANRLKEAIKLASIDKEVVAVEVLKAMLSNPNIAQLDFDTIADFACRQTDAFIKRLNEPEL